MRKQIPVDIITLNFNGLEFTKMFVESLYSNTTYPFNLIIVDNASTDGSVEYLKQLEKEKDNLKVHYNKERDKGFAQGNNTGLRYSKSPYVLFINNDIIIPKKGWLKRLVEVLESDEKIAIVGCKLLYPNDTIQHAGTYLVKSFLDRNWSIPIVWEHIGRFDPSYKYCETREIGGVTFACVLCRKEYVGTLDEEYLIGMYEDNAKCCEVRSKGYKIFYCGDVYLYHYETATQFKRPKHILENQRVLNFKRFCEYWGDWLIEDYSRSPRLYQIVDDEPRITAIVLTKNNFQTIEKCIKSLKYFDEILVYDSNSTDGTREYLKKKKVKILSGGDILDFSKARNELVWKAKYPYVFFLDADEEVNQDVYFELKEFFKRDSSFLVRFPRASVARKGYFYIQKYPDYQVRAGEKRFLEYRGKIHEFISYPKIFTSKYPIIHYGNCLEEWNLPKWKSMTKKNHSLGYYAPFESKKLTFKENFNRILRYYRNLQVEKLDVLQNLPKVE